jgi:biopolymer transport protein ExbD
MILRNASHSHRRAPIAHIDMTPLVDLGFLLLIFFMFLLTLQTPKVMEITMPEFRPYRYLGGLRHTPWVTIIVSPHNKVSMYGYGWLKEENNLVFNNQPKALRAYFSEIWKMIGTYENRNKRIRKSFACIDKARRHCVLRGRYRSA